MEHKCTSTVADVSSNLLPQLASFLAVIDAGSFTAAARQLGSDKTVLSRRVTALEEALGIRLLNRTTRALHVTDAGRRLADDAREPVASALAALMRTQASDQVEGTVRVASAQALAQAVWVPVLARLRTAHPALRVVLKTNESFSPLVEEGYDMAVRVGRMPNSSLVLRKLCTWYYLVVASPEWVAAHPEVQTPADLRPHWLLWGESAGAQAWTFQRGEQTVDVRMDQGALAYDASLLLTESARAGLGVTALPPFSVARELAEGSLVRVLPSWRPVHELGVYGVTPHRTMQPARVHVVLEAVRARISELAPVWAEMTQESAAG